MVDNNIFNIVNSTVNFLLLKAALLICEYILISVEASYNIVVGFYFLTLNIIFNIVQWPVICREIRL